MSVLDVIVKYWLQWAMGLLGASIVALWKKISNNRKEMMAKDKAMSSALCAILRDRIMESCITYLDKGEITATQLEVLKGLHESYTALGGNGVVKTLYERTQKLKIVIKETH